VTYQIQPEFCPFNASAVSLVDRLLEHLLARIGSWIASFSHPPTYGKKLSK